MSIFVILNFVFAHLFFSITFKDFMSSFSSDWIRFLSHSMYFTELSSSENISCQSLSFTNLRKPSRSGPNICSVFHLFRGKNSTYVLKCSLVLFFDKKCKVSKREICISLLFLRFTKLHYFFIQIIRFHCNWCD